jgi:hypothetical protein
MKRIGIAASKIAKGNLILYNLLVVVISFAFSLFIFFIAGSSIVIALLVIVYVLNGLLPWDLEKAWRSMLVVCLASLTIMMGILNISAILQNIKFKRGE